WDVADVARNTTATIAKPIAVEIAHRASVNMPASFGAVTSFGLASASSCVSLHGISPCRTNRQRSVDRLVQLAREPPPGGDHLGGAPTGAEPTGPGTRPRPLATHAGAEVGLVDRVGEQPQEQRTGADGALTTLPRSLAGAQDGAVEHRVGNRHRGPEHQRCQ